MKSIIVPLIVALSVWNGAVVSAEPESLYRRFDGQQVKIYVKAAANLSVDKTLDANQVKNQIENALGERKSIQFDIVQDVTAADLEVEITIKDFFWTDHDPVDMIMGVGSAAMDAATIEDYAGIDAEVIVRQRKDGRTIWKDEVRATVTKKPMAKTDSVPLVCEDFAKVFIKQCFGKKR